MSDFDQCFTHLSEEDREWLEKHQIINQADLFGVVDRLSNIFNILPKGILSSFTPVIEAFEQFLSNIHSHMTTNRLGDGK